MNGKYNKMAFDFESKDGMQNGKKTIEYLGIPSIYQALQPV